MNAISSSNSRRLLIVRTLNNEGLVYDVVSEDGNYKLKVELTQITKPLIKGIAILRSGLLIFKTESGCVKALLNYRSCKIDFVSQADKAKGCIREGSFSVIGKAVVEDENKRKLGWIIYGLKKDRVILGDGREIGFVARSSLKKLPLFVSAFKAHLVNRFEFVHELTPEFDDRLIYAWVCRKIWQENDSS